MNKAEQPTEEAMMSNDYALRIDGPLFRKQRELLMSLADSARNGRPVQLGPNEARLLEGLVEFSDEIADQAHQHGIDCLIPEPIEEGSP